MLGRPGLVATVVFVRNGRAKVCLPTGEFLWFDADALAVLGKKRETGGVP